MKTCEGQNLPAVCLPVPPNREAVRVRLLLCAHCLPPLPSPPPPSTTTCPTWPPAPSCGTPCTTLRAAPTAARRGPGPTSTSTGGLAAGCREGGGWGPRPALEWLCNRLGGGAVPQACDWSCVLLCNNSWQPCSRKPLCRPQEPPKRHWAPVSACASLELVLACMQSALPANRASSQHGHASPPAHPGLRRDHLSAFCTALCRRYVAEMVILFFRRVLEDLHFRPHAPHDDAVATAPLRPPMLRVGGAREGVGCVGERLCPRQDWRSRARRWWRRPATLPVFQPSSCCLPVGAAAPAGGGGGRGAPPPPPSSAHTEQLAQCE
jgi:hypothetical protein